MVLNNKYNATVLGNFAFVTTLLVFCVCDLLLDAKLSSKKSFNNLYCGNYTMWQFLWAASHHLMLSRAYLHFVSLFHSYSEVLCAYYCRAIASFFLKLLWIPHYAKFTMLEKSWVFLAHQKCKKLIILWIKIKKDINAILIHLPADSRPSNIVRQVPFERV